MPLALRVIESGADDSGAPESEAPCSAPPSRTRRQSAVTRLARPVAVTAPPGKSGSLEVSEQARHWTDLELVAALRSGRSWAAEALYVRVERVVERVLIRVLERRGSDYADLFQETFERLVRSLVEGRFEGACSLSTWAGAIASHVALDAIRARAKSRRCVGVEELERTKAGDCSRRVEARAEVRELLSVLSVMRPERAEAVFLFDVLGHSLPEVAELTDVSVAGAQSRLVRGRKELMERMGARPL